MTWSTGVGSSSKKRFRRSKSVASKAALLSAPSSSAACCRRSGLRPVMTTLAPSARARLAVSSPIPELPPITTTVCPTSCGSRRLRGNVVAVVMVSSRGRCRRWSERRDRGDDFVCGHNGTGVVQDIDVERGVHLLIRVARGRVLHHRDFVAKLSGIPNTCFHTRVRYQPHDDELMDAEFLELQIQICVSKATGTPMF